MAESPYAVLMMAYGSPESLDQIEAYLLDIRGGRPTPPHLVEEMRQRYALVGGRSPLVDITRAQARALEARLNADSADRQVAVYVGMRHWHPYIRDAVAQIAAEGHQRVVTLCMAPHYSRMSVGAYFQALRQAQEALHLDLDVTYVESWHTHPLFIQAVVEKVRDAWQKFPSTAREGVRIVFTAHSLPSSILADGDPYDQQLRETAGLVAAALRLRADQWQVCYQSAGARQVEWLGPQLKDVVVELAREGVRDILVAPVGFVADHLEILYDVDVEARRAAESAGAHLERTESMNTTPLFIEALADVVRKAVDRA